MNTLRRLLAACIAAALLELTSGPAHAEMRVCNGADQIIRYAVVADNSLLPVLFPNWVMEGWHSLDPGACRTIIAGSRLARAYLSAQKRATGGWRLALYEDGRQDNGGSTKEAVHRVFCVGDDGFTRSESTLDSHSNCPAGFYRQLFNLYLWSSSDTDFTMTLR